MTVVAAFFVGNSPVLIGDAALSIGVVVPTDFRPPTYGVGPPEKFRSKRGTVEKLVQKVIVVSRGCVIAWAGDSGMAKAAVREIRECNSRGELSRGWLVEYFRVRRTSLGETALIVGIVEGGKPYFECLGNHERECTVPRLGKVIFAGNRGTRRFEDLLAMGIAPPISATEDLTVRDALGAMIAANDAPCVAMQVTGSLLLSECITGDSIRDHFGGAYEICYWDGSGFRKLDNIANVFTRFDVADPAGIGLRGMDRVWWTHYVGNRTAVSTLQWGNTGDTRQIISRTTDEFGEFDDVHMHEETAPAIFDWAVTSAPWLCWHAAVTDGEKLLGVLPAYASFKAGQRTQKNSEMLLFLGNGTLNFSARPALIVGATQAAAALAKAHTR